jgi:serine/threonine protein kinase
LDGGAPVAVKLLRDERRLEGQSDLREFRRELSLNRAAHRTLAKVHGIADVLDTDRKALVMELVSGKPLVPNWWDNGVARPPGKSVRIVMQVLRAVRAMHKIGLRHNDIHPANILIDTERSESVKLVDLGNATPIRDSFNEGVASYLAPEQRNRRGDTTNQVTSDLYSVGAVLAFLVTGEAAPNKRQRRDLVPHVSAQVGEKTVTLREIIDKAMSHDPKARYQTAQEMIEALRPFSAGR